MVTSVVLESFEVWSKKNHNHPAKRNWGKEIIWESPTTNNRSKHNGSALSIHLANALLQLPLVMVDRFLGTVAKMKECVFLDNYA